MGLILWGCEAQNWQELPGSMSADACATVFENMLWSAYNQNSCAGTDLAPFWDSEDGSDAPEEGSPETWYNELAFTIIEGGLAILINPGVATTFVTVVKQFRLIFRTRNYGGIVDILMDDIPTGHVDTYSASPGLINYDIVSPGTTLKIVNSGSHNSAATPMSDGSYRVEFIRKRLWQGEIVPPNIRYDGTCACVQISTDGGATWVDQPAADPRTSPTYLFPPRGGTDPQCASAANMVANLHSFIDGILQILAETSVFTSIATVILTLTDVFGPFAVLVDLAVALADLCAAAGYAALLGAFTPTVYSELLCIFYCNLQTNGALTAPGFTAIQAQIASNIGGTTQTIMDGILALGGLNLLNNWGNTGTATNDCSGCLCGWCYQWLTPSDQGAWYAVNAGFVYPTNWGVYTPGTGWVNELAWDGAQFYEGMQIEIDFTPVVVTDIIAHYSTTSVAGNYPNGSARNYIDVWNGSAWVEVAGLSSPDTPGDYVLAAASMTATISKIRMTLYAGLAFAGQPDPGGYTVCTLLECKGNAGDTNPFGANNC